LIASTLDISEYVDTSHGNLIEPPIAHQTLEIGDEPVSCKPLNKLTRIVRVVSDVDCLVSISIGKTKPSQAQERERAAARAAAEARRAEAERKAIADPQKIVAIWNARQAGGRELWFYPTIGAAIAAGPPWLTYSCPACQQVGSVDLRCARSTGTRAPRSQASSRPSHAGGARRPSGAIAE
jgi:hypothetical protein